MALRGARALSAVLTSRLPHGGSVPAPRPSLSGSQCSATASVPEELTGHQRQGRGSGGHAGLAQQAPGTWGPWLAEKPDSADCRDSTTWSEGPGMGRSKQRGQND